MMRGELAPVPNCFPKVIILFGVVVGNGLGQACAYHFSQQCPAALHRMGLEMVCISHTWDIPLALLPPFPHCGAFAHPWLCPELQGTTEMSISSQAALPPTPGLAYTQGMEERPVSTGMVGGAISQGAQSSTDLGLWSHNALLPHRHRSILTLKTPGKCH